MPDFERDLPSEFEYLRQAAELCANENLQGFYGTEMPKFIANLTAANLELLASTFDEIEKREDVAEISNWYEACPILDRCFGYEAPVFRMFLVFEALHDNGEMPFSFRKLPFLERIITFDWSIIPEELSYLVEPAENYGKYQFDNEVDDFLRQMTAEDELAIRNIAAAIERNDDHLRIQQWLNEYPITDHPEAANVYFLLGIIDCVID